MLFHPDEQEGTSHAETLKLFTLNEDGNYSVTIKNPLQFQLIVDYLAAGLSFRQVVNVVNITRKHTGMAKLGNVTIKTVSNYARIACAINLQRITNILNNKSVWAFSLANNSSTHYGKSYFDNRIRFHQEGVLYNIHALTIPMFERHTGELMLKLITDFFDVVCPLWRAKLVSVSTDGASSMTGSSQGVVTRLEKKAQHKMYRVWCGIHQLDLVMKHAYRDVMDGEFNKIMFQLIEYLQELDHLSATLSTWIVIESCNAGFDNNTHYIFGRWAVSYQNIINYIFDRGIFIQDIDNTLSIELQAQVTTIVSKLVIEIFDGIANIQAERNSDNLPPVLPHELVKLPTRQFTSIVVEHLDRLKQFWGEEAVDTLERQHQYLLIEYQRDTTLQSAFDNCDGHTSFETGWSIVDTKKFNVLRDFCGGMASIFPNTATVESDFSILGWEKDEYRKSLTDLSLEGIIHCKQFELLSALTS